MNVMNSAAPAATAGGVGRLKAPEKFFINGTWVEPLSRASLQVVSPVTEEVILSYPEAGTADIDRAVAAARHAFDEGPWPRLTPAERARYLRKVARNIEDRVDDIVAAWVAQVGVPVMLAKKLAPQNYQLFDYYADLIEEAAALWESLAMNHGFIDGNKRIAFAVMDIFLDINGLEIVATQEDTERFIYQHLEAGTFNKDNLDAWLRTNTRPA